MIVTKVMCEALEEFYRSQDEIGEEEEEEDALEIGDETESDISLMIGRSLTDCFSDARYPEKFLHEDIFHLLDASQLTDGDIQQAIIWLYQEFGPDETDFAPGERDFANAPSNRVRARMSERAASLYEVQAEYYTALASHEEYRLSECSALDYFGSFIDSLIEWQMVRAKLAQFAITSDQTENKKKQPVLHLDTESYGDLAGLVEEEARTQNDFGYMQWGEMLLKEADSFFDQILDPNNRPTIDLAFN